MTISQRTRIATILRQYEQGIYDISEVYHLIAETYYDPQHLKG